MKCTDGCKLLERIRLNTWQVVPPENINSILFQGQFKRKPAILHSRWPTAKQWMSVLFYLKFFISVGIGDRRWTLTSYRKWDLFGLQLELLTWVNFNVICQESGWVVSSKIPVLDICSRRSEHLFDPDINQSALEATAEAISVIRHLRDKKSIFWGISRLHKTSRTHSL